MSNVKIKRALISVSDKTGVVEFARELESMGVELISTGGTLKTIKDAGVHIISVSSFTGAPEILGGRVKTLHPKVHAGILFRRGNEGDIEQMSQSDYKGIDLVVVNLYPFQETVAKPDSDDDLIIENIDIGGPSMIRSAAKNHASVTVVVDPSDYEPMLEQLRENDCSTNFEFRRECAKKGFSLTAEYDSAISEYFIFGKDADNSECPGGFALSLEKKSKLRYGENPHQEASLYKLQGFTGPSLLNSEQLAGKELSYNNYSDLDACLDMLLDFSDPFACVLKHANPCGAATGDTVADAYKKAYESDPLSAFGSIIGLNKEVDMAAAELLHDTPFVECILAPSFSEDAYKLLKKKKARRLLTLDAITNGRSDGELIYKYIRGGFLVQSADDKLTLPSEFKVVTKRQPTEDEIKEMLFGWKIVKHTKSNAIVLSKNCATVGIGMGQTSRVDAGFLAVKRAGDRTKGAVMSSDAFYPMPDGVEIGTDAGVTAIIQPGGSKGDDQAIEAADKANATMVFTGVRHFKH